MARMISKAVLLSLLSTQILVSCHAPSSQTVVHTKVTKNQNLTVTERIYIPQEKVYTQTAAPIKDVPASYITWLAKNNNYQKVKEYENYLDQQNVSHIVPSFELLRTARDWQQCHREQYAVPNRELWSNQVPTLKVFKYLVATKVLTDFEVTSVYRDLPTNQCAGGSTASRHLFNSAIDFRVGSSNPSKSDYTMIDQTKFKLCQFWVQYGRSLNLGLGVYASGQIHIDTQGYRTWGPNLSRGSSVCGI